MSKSTPDSAPVSLLFKIPRVAWIVGGLAVVLMFGVMACAGIGVAFWLGAGQAALKREAGNVANEADQKRMRELVRRMIEKREMISNEFPNDGQDLLQARWDNPVKAKMISDRIKAMGAKMEEHMDTSRTLVDNVSAARRTGNKTTIDAAWKRLEDYVDEFTAN